MPMHVSMYLCVHCGSVYNSFAECERHELEEHALDGATDGILHNIREMCTMAMARTAPSVQPPAVAVQSTPAVNRVARGGSVDDKVPPREHKTEMLPIDEPSTAPIDHLPFTFGDGIDLENDGEAADYDEILTSQTLPIASPQTNGVHRSRQQNQGAYQRKHPVVRCDHCDMYISIVNKKRHERLHTGERPYGCTVCGERFVQSTQLNTHCYTKHGLDIRRNQSRGDLGDLIKKYKNRQNQKHPKSISMVRALKQH